MQIIKKVAIFGFADARETDQIYQAAHDTAKLLAQNGLEIVDGGGPGIMKAASIGAKAGGGKVIGVTYYPKDANNFEGHDPANPFDEEVKTGNYVKRTLKLMELGDCYVIFPGGTGTISEFGMAWGLARLYFGHHKPLILYGQNWQPILACISQNMLLRPEEHQVYKIVNSPEQALAAIAEFDKKIQTNAHAHLFRSSEKAFQL